MKRFVKRRDSVMPTITMNVTETKDYESQMKEFNDFIKNNMEFIKRITPMNPTISKDDEWRTDDYSEYDKIRKNIKKGDA